MLEALFLLLMLLTEGCTLIVILGAICEAIIAIMEKFNLWEKAEKLFDCEVTK